MPSLPRLVCTATLALASACLCFPQSSGAVQQQELPSPSFHVELPAFLKSLLDPVSAPASPAVPAAGLCSVAPLDPIEDPAAQQLEASVDSGDVVDVAGMSPAAASALHRFAHDVAIAGGSIVLKSAYRPAAYQQHLQNVWYKWVELRNNHDAACQDLRAQVQGEFTRHHLIETQHPVAESDHTRGLAFDATVELPRRARLGRRRVTLDSLASLVGLRRPAVAADPVHFKFVGSERVIPVRYVRAAHVRRTRTVRVRYTRTVHHRSRTRRA